MAVGKPLRGHNGRVTALALGERSGRAVIVSGSEDSTVRVWDLESGVAVGEPPRDLGFGVRALALGKQADSRGIVSGGSVTAWCGCGTSSRAWQRASRCGATTVEFGHWHFGVSGRASAVIVSGDSVGTVRVWDLESGVLTGEPIQGHYSVCAAWRRGNVRVAR